MSRPTTSRKAQKGSDGIETLTQSSPWLRLIATSSSD